MKDIYPYRHFRFKSIRGLIRFESEAKISVGEVEAEQDQGPAEVDHGRAGYRYGNGVFFRGPRELGHYVYNPSQLAPSHSHFVSTQVDPH